MEPDYGWVDRELEEIYRDPERSSPLTKECEQHLRSLARLVLDVACDVRADAEAGDLAGALRSIADALRIFGDESSFELPEQDPHVPTDFEYVSMRLRKLNRTFVVHQSERSWDIADTAAVLNRVACRLPVESRNKNLARALHQIAAQLVSVSKLDHELDVPAAADLMHSTWHPGIRYG